MESLSQYTSQYLFPGHCEIYKDNSTSLLDVCEKPLQTKPFLSVGLDSAAQLHLAGGHPGGLVEESDMVAAVETAQTQRPGTAQQRSRKEGLAGISLEEQNILFSLDRLNQRLHRERFAQAVRVRPPNVPSFLHPTSTPACCSL